MQSELESRRARVLEKLGSAVLLLPSQPVSIRNHDVEHEYRQDSDFFYLTGFEEPECLAIFSAVSEQPFTLFLREKDPERERWDGRRLGTEAAVDVLGASQALPIRELEKRLADFLMGYEVLYYELGRFPVLDALVLGAVRSLRRRARQGVVGPTTIVEPSTLIHGLRMTKSVAELATMQRAADITCAAHRQVMGMVMPGQYEYELEAALRASFRRAGAQRVAYAPIVGSGPNATVLHYVHNDRSMLAGDLVLVDAGCELDYYAADVTRTFPVSGVFSDAQRALYCVVLEAQKASIEAARVGSTLEAVHQASVSVLVDGMLELSLLRGSRSEILEQKSFQKFYMHRTSHWLGMDVHDVGPYMKNGKHVELAEGMVLTVEPGLYIDALPDVPEAFHGIGIRIEDDVLVTGGEPLVLTQAAPKEIAEVEEACVCAARV